MIQNKLFRHSLAAIPDEQKAEFELSFGIAERMDAILKEILEAAALETATRSLSAAHCLA